MLTMEALAYICPTRRTGTLASVVLVTLCETARLLLVTTAGRRAYQDGREAFIGTVVCIPSTVLILLSVLLSTRMLQAFGSLETG